MIWSPRFLRTLAIVLGALLVIVGYWWWAGRARPVVALPEAAAVVDDTTPGAQVIVHVAGKVRHPGVVELPAGSRVVDAVEAAGGIRSGASPRDLNLARVLVDGEQIVVGHRARTADDPASPVTGGAPSLLDLNTASAGELEALPGIGPVLAQRIVQWRTDNGPFTAIDILGEVSGIGDSLLEQLRPLVRI